MKLPCKLTRVLELCDKHGYLFPSNFSEETIMCYNYGPLGTLFRQNLISEWWKHILRNESHIYPVESPPWITTEAKARELCSLKQAINETNNAKATFVHSSYRSNLKQGMIQHYLTTKQLVESKLPFGLAQVGSCFKQTQSSSEEDGRMQWSNMDEELCLHHYVPQSFSNQWLDHWKRTRLHWWKQLAGASSSSFHIDDQRDEKKTGAVKRLDIVFDFAWGSEIIETVENYGESPIQELQESVGIDCQGIFEKKWLIPQLIQCNASLNKGMVAHLFNAFKEEPLGADHSSNTQMLKLHPRLSPYKVAVCTTGEYKNTRAREMANHLIKELKDIGVIPLDLNPAFQNIKDLFCMHDEMGIPFTLILNSDTLEDGVALLRSRDTKLQEQISIAQLKEKLKLYLDTE